MGLDSLRQPPAEAAPSHVVISSRTVGGGKMSQVTAIIGLGNPGAEYDATRHNAGFWLVDAIARSAHTELRPEKKFLGLYAKAREGEIKDFTGISAPYEVPESPEIHLRTENDPVEALVDLCMTVLKTAGLIP